MYQIERKNRENIFNDDSNKNKPNVSADEMVGGDPYSPGIC